MSDQFAEVTTKSWGSRIMSSIRGVVIGFLMFIISFGILYANEGKINRAKVAKNATNIEASVIASPDLDQQFISSEGVLKSSEKIGDTYLKKGSYLSLKRNVEIYAWIEKTDSKSKTNMGGSETTETSYDYEKEWTNKPANSADFKKPEGHENQNLAINANSLSVKSASFGIYAIDINQINLPSSENIKLNNSNAIATNSFKLVDEKYLFKGKGTFNDPIIGDTRISYTAVNSPLENVTIFGKLDVANKKLTPYYYEENTKFYRVFNGSRDVAISTLKTEGDLMTWILRIVGFLLMWFGLMALLGPISTVLDVLPFFGSISRGTIGFVTFIISLILSIITILVSMIVHNIIALIVIILLFIVLMFMYLKKKKQAPRITSNNTQV